MDLVQIIAKDTLTKRSFLFFFFFFWETMILSFIYGPFRLRGKEGKQSRIEQIQYKINLFLTYTTLLYSPLLHSPSFPLPSKRVITYISISLYSSLSFTQVAKKKNNILLGFKILTKRKNIWGENIKVACLRSPFSYNT